MRNLNLQNCKKIDTQLNNVTFLLLNVNAPKDQQICYLVQRNNVYSYTNNVLKEITSDVVNIIGAEFLALDNKICVATAAGEVVLITPDTAQLDEGTYCDVGIESMSWSPDQEVVVFLTKTHHNVVVMTCTFDVLTEHALHDESASIADQFVNLGWGKKETQFHGSEGKKAAKKGGEFTKYVDISDLPQQKFITWRADSAYFAVSFVSPKCGRMFKVFDKEGQLCYASEQVDDLRPPLSWRPSGNWLAMPQRLPQKSIIVLFEKNGLRHREITLPFSLKNEGISNITWSSDSDILALETHSEWKKKLYLYTICNYHWYLKQTLAFSDYDPLVTYVWDTVCGEEKTLHLLLSSGKYLTYRWQMAVNATRGGMVGVIDGKKLLITDFKQNIVPPPMCQSELPAHDFIVALEFSADTTKLATLDVQQALHLYESMDKQKPTCFTHVCAMRSSDSIADEELLINNIPLDLLHLRWLCARNNLFVCINAIGELLVLQANISKKQYTVVYRELWHGGLCAISNIGDDGTLYAQNYDGNIYEFQFDIENIKCDKCKLIETGTGKTLQRMHFVKSGKLIIWYADQTLSLAGRCIASDVTSFGIAGNFLVYTQLTTLHFVNMNDGSSINERKIERGAKIVVIMEEDGRIVLQMPRGNLEVFVPRTLALKHIGSLLNNQEYVKAFEMLRKHRINLNIICDHDMVAFVKHVDKFLNDIKNPQWLNLFISDLQNEDFTRTMYAASYKAVGTLRNYPPNFDICTKVEFICKCLCQRMEDREDEEGRFQLPIITAYVKVKQVEKALLIIWKKYQHEKQDERSGATPTSQAEDALRYLLYLVDVNELYDVALGTYDFGLVLFVAQRSQKDPKEYLLSLNELKALPTEYRKFRIDDTLKRYTSALEHITRCGEEYLSEAVEFIKRHVLYKHALKCYETLMQEDGENDLAISNYRLVALAFADYLRTNGHHSNASLMYERGGNLAQAQLSARNALDWQRVLIFAQQLEQDLAQVAISLVRPLEEQNQHEIAYHVLITYANDEHFNYDIAIQSLLRGKLFLKAIYEARMWKATISKDVINRFIRPELVDYYGQLKNNLQVDRDLFVDYKKRLVEVREKKANYMKELEINDENMANIDEIDLLSDTTSVRSSQYTSSSKGTGKTFRSSKNRRKHERKLLSLKPGNPFEDIALIDALHNQVMKIVCVKQQEHIRDICKALLEMNLDAMADDVQCFYREILDLVRNSLDEIWIPELMSMNHLHLTGPNVDYTQLKNEQRYALIDPLKRIKPQLQLIEWEQFLLNYQQS